MVPLSLTPPGHHTALVFVEAEGEMSGSGHGCLSFAGFLGVSVPLPYSFFSFRNNEIKLHSPVLFILVREKNLIKIMK